MPHRCPPLLYGLLFFVFVALLPCRAAAQDAGTVFLVSFPAVKLSDAERIVGFRCTVVPGRILSLREFPEEWQITVQNGDSETATVRGQILVGTAAFSARWNNTFFLNFMKVKLPKPSPDASLSQITGELQITTDNTFEHYRYVRFGRFDIKLQELPEPAARHGRM